jgi:hypothetical protein
MKSTLVVVLLSALVFSAYGKTYFAENFNGEWNVTGCGLA